METRRYRAGATVEDRCRACKIDRLHTVIVSDGEGRPVRVQCDYCGSQHNFRGGVDAGPPAPAQRGPTACGPTRPAAPRLPIARRSRSSPIANGSQETCPWTPPLSTSRF